MFIGTQIVDPDFLCPGFFASRFFVEEENVSLDALCIKYTSWQSQQSVDIVSRQQTPPHSLAGTTLKEYIVRHDHRRAAVDLQQGGDVLYKVELFVAGGSPEIIPFVSQ